jgi:hypothetical protein
MKSLNADSDQKELVQFYQDELSKIRLYIANLEEEEASRREREREKSVQRGLSARASVKSGKSGKTVGTRGESVKGHR